MTNDKLLHIHGNSYAWAGKYAVGVYLHPDTQEAYLIDSGPNEKTAEMIHKEIVGRGFQVNAIIHTHGHEVNTGGTRYFKKKYPDLKVYASNVAAPFVNSPSLHAPFLSTNQQQTVDQLTRPSIVTDTILFRAGVVELNGIAFRIHTLPGHSPGMIGVQTQDQVLYCADALFGFDTLARQRILYFTELKEARRSLDKLRTIAAKHFVLYHGGSHHSITELIGENAERIDQAYHDIFTMIEQQWQTTENITQRIMSRYNFDNTDKQYDMAYMITNCYLSQLLNDGKIYRFVKNGMLFYKKNDDIV